MDTQGGREKPMGERRNQTNNYQTDEADEELGADCHVAMRPNAPSSPADEAGCNSKIGCDSISAASVRCSA